MKVVLEFEVDLDTDKYMINALSKSETLELKGSKSILKDVNAYGNTRHSHFVGQVLRKLHDLAKHLSDENA